jgi:hypothetical protein
MFTRQYYYSNIIKQDVMVFIGMYGEKMALKGKPERRVFVDLGVDGSTRLKCTLKKSYWRAWIVL